ncbi:MAG: hypothetical protein ACJ754_21480 [Pyrinomonadaceae bacterium]
MKAGSQARLRRRVLLLAFGGATRAQQGSQKLVVKSDKNSPRKAPEKSAQKTTGAPAASPQSAGRAPAEPTTDTTTKDIATSAPQAASSSPSGCDYGTILVGDTIRVIFVDLFNNPPNSAIPVTMTQTNAGTIGFALTDPQNHYMNIASLMSDTAIPSNIKCHRDKKKEIDAIKEQKLRHFGTALHYVQDTYSHAGYTSDRVGHGIEVLRGHQHMPDKTHGTARYPITNVAANLRGLEYSRVDRAMSMVRDTWDRMKQWCKDNKCFDRPAQQERSFKQIEPLVRKFLSSNGSRNNSDPNANPDDRSINDQEVDIKRQILRIPLRPR